ncbi:MFS transporter [Alteromonas lipotrueiana]|uniref:MFS transporter n=1 Tax=Alteromonas lipotrueiana TaxID=2803815 RepID=UPI001C45C48F|nr:MFS transporter [Alteromonas lipotrueiana]
MTYLILFCALLATAVGQSVFLTTVPSLGRLANLSEMQVAVMMSSSALVFAIGANVWSRYTLRYGYRKLLLLGLSGYTLGTFVFATIWWAGLNGWLSGTILFTGLLISRCLQSSVMSATPPSVVGYVVAVSSSKERASSISKVTSANNLGQILGPPLAGLLVGAGILAPFYFVIVFTLLAIVLVAKKLPDLNAAQAGQSGSDTIKSDIKIKSSTLLLISCCVCLFGCMAIMQQSLAFFLMDTLDFSAVGAARQAGLAMMVMAVFSLIIQFTVVQRHWLRPTALIYIALPLTAVGYAVLYFQQELLHLYIGLALMGAGFGAAYPSIAAVATARCEAAKQAKVTGLITASPAMGYITGPPISAALFNLDERWPFLAAALLMGIASLVVWLRLPNRPV